MCHKVPQAVRYKCSLRPISTLTSTDLSGTQWCYSGTCFLHRRSSICQRRKPACRISCAADHEISRQQLSALTHGTFQSTEHANFIPDMVIIQLQPGSARTPLQCHCCILPSELAQAQRAAARHTAQEKGVTPTTMPMQQAPISLAK
jgi:hypothetical protein